VKLSLSRSEADKPGWPRPPIVRGLAAIAAMLEPLQSRVDLILVDDQHIRSINRTHRGVDRPTDVLSFSYPEDADSAIDGDLVGEIYVSWETLERDATARNLEIEHLFLRVGIHGLLHIVGYDHETDRDALEMEGEERRLLRASLNDEQVEALFEQ
jgi:probable rRNA maturation factor